MRPNATVNVLVQRSERHSSVEIVRYVRHLGEGVVLAYGFDHTAVGFFITVERPEAEPREYDGLTAGYDHERPLLGAEFLVTAEVITEDDLYARLWPTFVRIAQ